jgi:uncharacterized small protein (DUF1192 family)
MDEQELEPRRRIPEKKNLEPLGLAELEAYIAELEEEIARVRRDIDGKRRQRSGAEALFRK